MVEILSIPAGSFVGRMSEQPPIKELIIRMAEYLVLLYENEAGYTEGGPDIYREVLEAHNRFGEKYAEALRGGNALQGAATATTIRGDVVTDGPFVESKEVLGGYYLIEAADLDGALEIAKAVPARFGGVEVRPVMVLPGD